MHIYIIYLYIERDKEKGKFKNNEKVSLALYMFSVVLTTFQTFTRCYIYIHTHYIVTLIGFQKHRYNESKSIIYTYQQ